jgi:hypothetical protein
MKTQNFIPALIFLISCTNEPRQIPDIQKPTARDTIIRQDTAKWNDPRDWQAGFGLTHNPNEDTVWHKLVSYYISDKECSGLAKDFYYGELRPSDNGVTEELLELVTTDNAKLRPFYRWCLDKTIQIQDGALGEYTGVPARQYAEKFPKEFFEYMDYDTTGDIYLDWVSSILYSGFYKQDDYKKPQDIRQRMARTMKKNCNNCTEQIKKRIDKFVMDCFQ